jgi:hypothetical protein
LHLLKKYNHYDWNNQTSESLYSSFKELEKVLKIMIEVEQISHFYNSIE